MKPLLIGLLILSVLFPALPVLAARGCGSTDGSGTTDVMTSGAIASTTARSFFVRYKFNANPAASMRILGASSTVLSEMHITTTGHIGYTAGWSGGNGVWAATDDATTTGVWHTAGVTYNGTATTVDPIIYQNGASKTISESATPTTALNSATQAYLFCNVAAGNRVFDGTIAEFAIWNVILTAQNMTDLHNGARPDQIGTAPLHYWKFCGKVSPEPADVGAVTVTVTTGALLKQHPVGGCSQSMTLLKAG